MYFMQRLYHQLWMRLHFMILGLPGYRRADLLFIFQTMYFYIFLYSICFSWIKRIEIRNKKNFENHLNSLLQEEEKKKKMAKSLELIRAQKKKTLRPSLFISSSEKKGQSIFNTLYIWREIWSLRSQSGQDRFVLPRVFYTFPSLSFLVKFSPFPLNPENLWPPFSLK